MKKFLLFGVFMTFFFHQIYSQANETFSNVPNGSSTSSYQTRTWIGDNGVPWKATNSRSDQTLTGKAITIRGNTGYVKNTTPVPGGCGTLTFNYKRVFSGNSTMKVYVNGAQVGSNITVSATTTAVFSQVVNVTGDITVEIKNLTGGKRIVIDDLSWDAYAPLPIDITSFSATPRSHQVSLTWETATEINNDYFTLERSTNGQRFEAIGKVLGAGNSTTTQRYAFFDKTPMRGTNYYRLAQTDYDGQSETFDVVSVDFKGTGTTTIRPTQVKDIMTLSLEPMETVGRVTIFNLVGQKVYDAAIEAGSTSMEIDAVAFAHGQYFARVANGNFVETVRFIKQ